MSYESFVEKINQAEKIAVSYFGKIIYFGTLTVDHIVSDEDSVQLESDAQALTLTRDNIAEITSDEVEETDYLQMIDGSMMSFSYL